MVIMVKLWTGQPTKNTCNLVFKNQVITNERKVIVCERNEVVLSMAIDADRQIVGKRKLHQGASVTYSTGPWEICLRALFTVGKVEVIKEAAITNPPVSGSVIDFAILPL